MADLDGQEWNVEQHGAGICLTRPGAMRWVSFRELENLTGPGLTGLRPGKQALIRAEYEEVE